MRLPAYGICSPCWLVRVIDADTIVVRLDEQMGQKLPPVRLIDCWAAETRGPQKILGLPAKQYAEALLESAGQLSLQIPDEVLRDKKTGVLNAMGMLGAFNRLLGNVFLDSETTLAEKLIEAKHAFETKEELYAHLRSKGIDV